MNIRANRASRIALTIALLGGAGALIANATDPALAAGALAAVRSAVTCASNATCLSVSNTTGTAVAGTSALSFGLFGVSANANGVLGKSTSAAGVSGSSDTGPGVSGVGANGVTGQALNEVGDGVVGTTSLGAGVRGLADGGVGLYGKSTKGVGVFAIGSAGPGLMAFTSQSSGVYGNSSSGEGVDAESGSGLGMLAHSATNAAIVAKSDGGVVAIYGYAPAGNGAEISGSHIGLVGRSSNIPLYLSDLAGNEVFSVDGVGNVYFHGDLRAFSRTASGATVTAYNTKSVQATVEDTGTAQLVDGAAAVRLDPAFTEAIERASGYRVFLTPDGETHGSLYVQSKAAGGFIVRETQGGHSTVSFDYRIVATALGEAHARMAVTPGAFRPGAPTAKPFVVPARRTLPPLPPQR